MTNKKMFDLTWGDDVMDVTSDANFIWNIANKLRGVYMPDKYGDVIIPMTIIRRFECALEKTKDAVVAEFEAMPTTVYQKLCKTSGFQFYNTSRYTLKELCNDSDHIAENFKAYIKGFSTNVQNLLLDKDTLNMDSHIDTMDKGGCLFQVVKEFSELDLSIEKYDSIRMGYIFENLIGRFFQNVDAGQYYTGRDIIRTLFAILVSEGCEDIFDDHKIITVCDQACGTGGMLSVAEQYLRHFNPTADVRLFGQEYNGVSHAIGLAEMLIKGQDSKNFRHQDTFKEDCFKGQKMRFVIENPPFGTPWSGDSAKDGQEDAVRKEFAKPSGSRWPAGLPSGGDSQLIFMQSAIDKMADGIGRAAIISNGSPLFTGGTASGESQIRRWMLESDLIEAIIALPTDLFYNTGIQTYAWILSKNKRAERVGKIQLIDASKIFHKLRKAMGNKKNELRAEDRIKIVELYNNFEKNELSKIYDNTEFLYREYTVMQPLQRSYAITKERIETMLSKGSLNALYDEAKVYELENPTLKEEKKDNKKKTQAEIEKVREKELKKIQDNKNKLNKFYENKPVYDKVLSVLESNISDKVYLKKDEFEPVLKGLLGDIIDSKLIAKVLDGLSVMDKNAEIQLDKKKNVQWDKESKDTEIVPYKVDIRDYMAKEVLPHVPDAQHFFEGNDENATFEEDRGQKVVKIGAEIPFTRYFYKYQAPRPSDELLAEFLELDRSVNERIKELLK